MSEIKHPIPLGCKGEQPAPPVTVRYLHDVTAPDFKAGKKGDAREIEKHWAEQLVAEGYCELVENEPAKEEEASPAHQHETTPTESDHDAQP